MVDPNGGFGGPEALALVSQSRRIVIGRINFTQDLSSAVINLSRNSLPVMSLWRAAVGLLGFPDMEFYCQLLITIKFGLCLSRPLIYQPSLYLFGGEVGYNFYYYVLDSTPK